MSTGVHTHPGGSHLQEVYGDWVYTNDGRNLIRDIVDNAMWQTRWKLLAVMQVRR